MNGDARYVVADLSDLHCGHRLGLLNPSTTILEGCSTDLCEVALGPTQKRLWRIYDEHVSAVADMAGTDPVVLVFKGDLTHGTKHKEGLAYICLADQLAIAFWCIVPWLERCPNVQKIVIIEGTEAHTHYSSTERILSLWLKSHYYNIEVVYTGHGLLKINDVELDMAHHGAHPGSKIHLQNNNLIAYGRDTLLHHLTENTRPPNLISRGHFHEYRHAKYLHWARGREWEIDLFITPSYCGMTGYARKATKSMPVEVNGMVAHEVCGNYLMSYEFLEPHDVRTVVEVA